MENEINHIKTINESIVESVKELENMRGKKTGISGVPSGFPELDRLTAGWQNSNLIILAARPSMGKTALAMTFARNAAVEFKIPVAIFTLEMSNLQLSQRFISSETELSLSNLRKGQLQDYEYEQLTSKISKLSDAPIYIDDTSALTLSELIDKSIKLKKEHNIQMIVIDYLQLMTLGTKSRENREQEISLISRELKSLSKKLDIPIIALSQLSRSVEQRGVSKRPLLSDLRDSGALEDDADVVMFIYREDYYYMEDPESHPGSAEIIIAKHRNGPLDSIHLRFLKEFAKFVDEPSLSDYHNYQVDEPSEPRNITRSGKINDIEEEGPF